MAEHRTSDARMGRQPESRLARTVWWVLLVIVDGMTATLIAIVLSIVLFEKGDFGPPPRSDTATVLWCVAVMLVCNLVLPWLMTYDARVQVWEWRAPLGLHLMVGLYGMVSMLGYLMVIDPAGDRRGALTLAIPAVLLPVGYVLAWRACQIGAKAVGRPARDAADWTALDHLLGRRRSAGQRE